MQLMDSTNRRTRRVYSLHFLLIFNKCHPVLLLLLLLSYPRSPLLAVSEFLKETGSAFAALWQRSLQSAAGKRRRAWSCALIFALIVGNWSWLRCSLDTKDPSKVPPDLAQIRTFKMFLAFPAERNIFLTKEQWTKFRLWKGMHFPGTIPN